MTTSNPFIETSASILPGGNSYTYVTNNPLKYTDPSGYVKTPRWKQWVRFIFGIQPYIRSRDGNKMYTTNDSDDDGGGSGGGGGGGISYYDFASSPFDREYNHSPETEYSPDVNSKRPVGVGAPGRGSGNGVPDDPPKETSDGRIHDYYGESFNIDIRGPYFMNDGGQMYYHSGTNVPYKYIYEYNDSTYIKYFNVNEALQHYGVYPFSPQRNKGIEFLAWNIYQVATPGIPYTQLNLHELIGESITWETHWNSYIKRSYLKNIQKYQSLIDQGIAPNYE